MWSPPIRSRAAAARTYLRQELPDYWNARALIVGLLRYLAGHARRRCPTGPPDLKAAATAAGRRRERHGVSAVLLQTAATMPGRMGSVDDHPLLVATGAPGSLPDRPAAGARGYDRIAGYFRSSMLEVAGDALELMAEGACVRVICNSELHPLDVATARAAKDAMHREWRRDLPADVGPPCGPPGAALRLPGRRAPAGARAARRALRLRAWQSRRR